MNAETVRKTEIQGLGDQVKETQRNRMSNAIGAWITDLENYPGWREWKRKQIGYTLHFDDPQPLFTDLRPACRRRYSRTSSHSPMK